MGIRIESNPPGSGRYSLVEYDEQGRGHTLADGVSHADAMTLASAVNVAPLVAGRLLRATEALRRCAPYLPEAAVALQEIGG